MSSGTAVERRLRILSGMQLVVCLAAGLYVLLAYRGLSNELRLHGTEVNATIVDIPSTYMVVEYVVDGRAFRESVSCGGDRCAGLYPGNDVLLRVDPAEPARAVRAETSYTPFRATVAGTIGVLSAAGAGVTWWLLRRHMAASRMVSGASRAASVRRPALVLLGLSAMFALHTAIVGGLAAIPGTPFGWGPVALLGGICGSCLVAAGVVSVLGRHSTRQT